MSDPPRRPARDAYPYEIDEDSHIVVLGGYGEAVGVYADLDDAFHRRNPIGASPPDHSCPACHYPLPHLEDALSERTDGYRSQPCADRGPSRPASPPLKPDDDEYDEPWAPTMLRLPGE